MFNLCVEKTNAQSTDRCIPFDLSKAKPQLLISAIFHLISKYTRQNKLRVTSRSKQCNSIFNEMPGLIPISDCFNNLTDDI